MREIKFRGKRIDNLEWVFGDLIENQGRFFIYHSTSETTIKDNNNGYITIEAVEIDNSTVGQFTGLHDKNGKEIYEGDILQYIGRGADIIGKIYYREVTFKEGSFCIYCKDLNIHSPISGYITNGVLGWDVVGNIHDTPELLKGGKE